MTNSDHDPQRITADVEALMALLDAELHADDHTHPDHVPMPPDEELSAMAERAFDRAALIVAAETAAIGTVDDVSDELLADVVASWTSRDLGLVSSTRAVGDGEGRLWKVRVSDPDLVAAVLGPDGDGPLYLTVSDVPSTDGITVTVTLSLAEEVTPGIALVAVIDYGDGVRARIPLYQNGPGDPDQSGHAVVTTGVGAGHPILTLDVLRSR